MQKSTEYWITAGYKESGAEVVMDASPAVFMRDAMNRLSKRWMKKFDDIAKKLAQKFSLDSMLHSDVSLKNALGDAGFTVEFKMTPAMNNALQATISENVGLIRSIPEKYFTEVEGMVMRSVARGRDLSTLTDELQQRYGITRRRAALIARDQNQKSTSVMQTARQLSLGITQGIWRHSHAGKEPRKSHVAADGKIFELSEGLMIDGELIYPAQKINCRCTWSPVIKGLS
jgi:SPP1 gp7 family putative phage head morphogenesis protein